MARHCVHVYVYVYVCVGGGGGGGKRVEIETNEREISEKHPYLDLGRCVMFFEILLMVSIWKQDS